MRLSYALLLLMLLWVLPLSLTRVSRAGEFIPLPSFSTYEIKSTQNPLPLPQWREYLDVTALFVGLSLASYFALVKRSRRGLFLLTIVSLLWLGFWRKGCICPIGAIGNVTLAVCDSNYIIPLSAIVIFILPLVFTLFFGRTFCAAVCPLGAMQELVAIRPVQTPVWLDHALGLLAYVYLGAAVLFAATGTAFVICRYDPFVGFFRLSASANMLILGACFLVVGVFVGRPYCRYLCPYGAILGLVSKVSKWHVKITPDICIQCRLCEESCPYGAIREPTVALSAARASPRAGPIGSSACVIACADRFRRSFGKVFGCASFATPSHSPACRDHAAGKDRPIAWHQPRERCLRQKGNYRGGSQPGSVYDCVWLLRCGCMVWGLGGIGDRN